MLKTINKRMANKILSFALCIIIGVPLIFSFSIKSQAADRSDRLRPKWIVSELPEARSNAYFFVRSHGAGSSIEDAKKAAFIAMIQRLESEHGLSVSTKVQISESFSSLQTDETDSGYKQTIELEVVERGRNINISCREIDDYWQHSQGYYHVDVLYAVANGHGGSYENEISVTTHYPVSFIETLVPGLSQLSKGDNAKGYSIISGEIIAAGGILLCELTSSSYLKKMIEQPKHAMEYNSLADQWNNSRNICIGAAVALFSFSIIDAIVSPGAKYIKVRPKSSNHQLTMHQYADYASQGLSLCINF